MLSVYTDTGGNVFLGSVVSLDCTAIGSILLKIVGEKTDCCHRPASIGLIGDHQTGEQNGVKSTFYQMKIWVQNSPNRPQSSEITESN